VSFVCYTTQQHKEDAVLQIQSTFSGFSVSDIEAAKQFYGTILGLQLKDEVGGTSIALPAGAKVWMYQKEDHRPATYTMLNLIVDDIDQAHEALSAQGVTFERYPDSYQDEKGIMRGKSVSMGPNIAWFKDPAGNILAILES
jgi:catechol 2,3-dioxygenase-like lactoylglutathione lyase family enzyme